MALGCREISRCGVVLIVYFLEVLILTSPIGSNQSETTSRMILDTAIIQSDTKGYKNLRHFRHCNEGKEHDNHTDNSDGPFNSHRPNENIDITVTYTDASGVVKLLSIKSRDLSTSWVWENSTGGKYVQTKARLNDETSLQRIRSGLQASDQPSTDDEETIKKKLRRQQLREKRKKKRTKELLQLTGDIELQMEKSAIEYLKQVNTSIRRSYSIWRGDTKKPPRDFTLKLMKDQIIMAKIYTSIARSKNKTDLHEFLENSTTESKRAIGEATLDSELHQGALERAKAMGHALVTAKDQLYDCPVVERKLRAMLQYTEENVDAQKKKSLYLLHLAARTIPKSLHCLSLQLTTDYFLREHNNTGFLDMRKLEDPSLYHYAIFSDNVLATNAAINSTVINAKEPEKHVFHIVTERSHFAAMKMWFIVHPIRAAVHVENIDELKWLNSSYCPVLRQAESAEMIEYYFKANHPLSISAADDNLNYKNPKYLSMLNHIRFYMPEMYPKLDKILFLDDDVVVQKDLTELWSIDMKGMVNGAVETCNGSFHQFDQYLNFSSPEISKNFDPRACGWAFGMNIFDLKEWKKQNITGKYHYWQELNGNRTMWQLGSLPPGLIAFYDFTYALDRKWHLLGLGYKSEITADQIDEAAVIHYNGNYKPWLDLAFKKFKPYWSKYVNFDDRYLRGCKLYP